jgi:hypothetical protein
MSISLMPRYSVFSRGVSFIFKYKASKEQGFS